MRASTSAEPPTHLESPGAQTLASLKEEALKVRQSKRRLSTTPGQASTPRRRVSRSCEILKEEYFERMSWTRTFVSVPVSIYGKGATEMLRHYATERQLCKDQRRH